LNVVLSAALALLIALVFAAAAFAKLTAWSELPGVVQNFRVLPRALVMPVALLLPLLEAAIAPGILIKETRSAAAVSAALLFAVFGAALAINYCRGRRHIDCGCFRSELKQPISIAVIVRNALLAVCALLLLLPADAAAALSPLAWAIAVAAAVTLFLCYLSVGLLFQAPAPSYEDNFHAARGTLN
jgi:hypothetical protein